MPGTTQTILLRPDPNEPEKERAWISPEIEAQIKVDIADAMKLIDNHVMLSQHDRHRVEHIVEYLVEMAHYAVALQQEQIATLHDLPKKLGIVLEKAIERMLVDDPDGVIETIDAYLNSTLRNQVPLVEKVETSQPPPLDAEQQRAFVALATRDDILIPEPSFTPLSPPRSHVEKIKALFDAYEWDASSTDTVVIVAVRDGDAYDVQDVAPINEREINATSGGRKMLLVAVEPSEQPQLEPGDDALLDLLAAAQDFTEGNNSDLLRMLPVFDADPYIHALQRVRDIDAPNPQINRNRADTIAEIRKVTNELPAGSLRERLDVALSALYLTHAEQSGLRREISELRMRAHQAQLGTKSMRGWFERAKKQLSAAVLGGEIDTREVDEILKV